MLPNQRSAGEDRDVREAGNEPRPMIRSREHRRSPIDRPPPAGSVYPYSGVRLCCVARSLRVSSTVSWPQGSCRSGVLVLFRATVSPPNTSQPTRCPSFHRHIPLCTGQSCHLGLASVTRSPILLQRSATLSSTETKLPTVSVASILNYLGKRITGSITSENRTPPGRGYVPTPRRSRTRRARPAVRPFRDRRIIFTRQAMMRAACLPVVRCVGVGGALCSHVFASDTKRLLRCMFN